MQNKLKNVITNNTMVGYHLEMITSILTPELYKIYMLGKKSAHVRCVYGHTPKSLIEMEYWLVSNKCLACESLYESEVSNG